MSAGATSLHRHPGKPGSLALGLLFPQTGRTQAPTWVPERRHGVDRLPRAAWGRFPFLRLDLDLHGPDVLAPGRPMRRERVQVLGQVLQAGEIVHRQMVVDEG